MHRRPRLPALLATTLAATLGCTAAGGRGSTAKAGGSCKASQAENDTKLCDSSHEHALECKETDVAGTYAWKEDKDCAAKGLVCSSGECVTPSTSSGGDKDATSAGGSDTSGVTSGGCADLAGTWAFDEHCDARYLGSTVTVSQTQCTFSFNGGGITNARGTITGTSKITVTGTSTQGLISCTGDLEYKGTLVDKVKLDCAPPCDLKVSRADQ